MAANQQSSAAPAVSKPFQTKLVLLGEAAVGKSSVVLRFVSNEFAENKQPTIGAAFLTQKCRLEDKVIKFEIWDTAGQERFHSLAPMYYRNAQASAVIYDVTKASSFEKAKSWVKELQRQANPNIIIALVGNKIDLLTKSDDTSATQPTDEEDANPASSADAEEDDAAVTTAETASGENLRAVPKEEAQAYANESGLLFFETSAKTGEGVIEVFTEIAKKISPQDIQQSAQGQAGAGAGNAGAQGGRTGRNATAGNVELGEDAQSRRQDACNC